jgi:hypothetical protein
MAPGRVCGNRATQGRGGGGTQSRNGGKVMRLPRRSREKSQGTAHLCFDAPVASAKGAGKLPCLACQRHGWKFLEDRLVFACELPEMPEAVARGDFGHGSGSRIGSAEVTPH